MAINKIDLNQLPNARNVQFHKEISDVISDIGADKLKIGSLYEKYKQAYGRVDDGFQNVNKSEFTEKLQNADKERDQTFIEISEIIRAYIRDFDADIKDSANRLKILIDTYGNIANKPLYDQTAFVDNFIDDLDKKYKTDIQKLHIERLSVELKRQNAEFDAIAKQRLKEGVAKNDVVLKEARKDLDSVYRAIVRRIEAFIEIDGIADYAEFVKTVNILVAKFGGGSRSTTTPSWDDTPATPPTDGTSQSEDKYPDAREWGDLNPDEWKNGDICFVMVDGEKKYYELIDIFHIDIAPTDEEGSVAWREK